ncbi:hypothetical protein [Cylindrospermum sp. FACHB-282]|uniref:hypothetical protein n=1 Tax=Cylindrospermum sp. FACHB-282 TaxID=2692794 RepID=UPI001684A4D8|nr:hypothetical protein [Cylindrospermum sp. FACHB-282]MBD2386036.1 hypothetical protein [Cylindrospermum sp. FACHB-282]
MDEIIFLVERASLAQKLGFLDDAIDICEKAHSSLLTFALNPCIPLKDANKILFVGNGILRQIIAMRKEVNNNLRNNVQNYSGMDNLES